MNKLFKAIMVTLIILLAITISVMLFVNFHPVFGGKPSKASLERMAQSPNYKDGKFKNLEPTTVMLENNSMWATMIEWIKGPENGTPDSVVTKAFDKAAFLNSADSSFAISWFGHSTAIIKAGNKIILTDPVFSSYASPLPFTNRSFKYTNPINIEDLPEIDILLISHDHYDHLDHKTIKNLDHKVKAYYVPLGVEAHLLRWGVSTHKIHIADWWDEFKIDESLTLAATPARHFSGRGFTRNETLWCSWVIKGPQSSIYFGADSGYGGHFNEIGSKYGPFDLTMIECGQYNKNWALIHAMPEESVQAHLDLAGITMMTIHWGKFQLALHSWTDPIERAGAEADRKNVKLLEPMIGDIITIE